jgi:hypothetical protein
MSAASIAQIVQRIVVRLWGLVCSRRTISPGLGERIA